MTTTVASVQAIFSADTTNLMAGLRKADSAITGLGNNLQSVGGNISAFGSSLGAVALPAAAALGGATFAAMNFNEAITNANSILQLSQGEIQSVSDKVLAMGTNAIAGPQAVAESYYNIVSGVQDTTTHMAILDTAIAVSEAGASSLDGTTSALVASMNAYGASAEEAAHFGDVLSRTTALGVGTMDEFAAALPNVTSLASNLGISFDDVGAQMAFMTTKGFTASESATMLKASMTALINPNETMIKAYQELGVASGDALIEMYGLDGAMQAIAGTSVVASDGLAKTLGSTEALNGALILTGEGAGEFFDTFINGIDGSTAAARKLQRQSAAAQFKLIKAQVAGLAITIGTALLPALMDLMEVISPIIIGLSRWAYENPKIVTAIAAIAFGAAALASVLIPLGMAITLMGTAVVGLGSALGVVAAAFGLLLTPIGLVVVALAALGVAYKTNFLGFADAVDSLVPTIEALARTAKSGFNTIAKNIEAKALPAIEDLWVKAQDLPNIFDGLNNIDIGNIFGGLVDSFDEFVNGWQMTNEQLGVFADYLRIAGVAIGLFVPYVGILIAVATALYTAYEINFLGFADLINSAVPIVGDALAQITGFFAGFISSLQAGNIGSFIQDSIITPLVSGLSGFVSGTDLQATAASIGASILSALNTGLDMLGSGATWVMDNLITPLANQVTGFVANGGLKDAMYNLGKGLADALQIGLVLLGGIGTFIATNLIAPLASSVAQYVSSGQLWEDLKTFGSNIPVYIKEGLNAIIAVDTFIYENIVAPFTQGIADSLAEGVIWENLKAFGTQMITSIQEAITTTIPNFIANNIAIPLADMILTTDWGGAINGIAEKGAEIVESLGAALIDGVSGLASSFAAAINALIPDEIKINIGSITVGKPPLSKTIDFGSITIPLPDPLGFASGTPWTGNMPRNQVAGVVHGQEAVIPTHGMMAKVVPSSHGLMVQMSGQSGGSSGGGFNIYGDINVYGVQDKSSLLDELTLEARRRGTYLGAA